MIFFGESKVDQRAIFLSVVFVVFFQGCSADYKEKEDVENASSDFRLPLSGPDLDSNTEKIVQSVGYEKAAKELLRKGQYADAISKYRQAILPDNINYDWEESVSRGAIRKIYVLQESYDLALNELLWIKDRNPKEYLRLKEEIDVRSHYFRTGDPFRVLEYITRRRMEHKKFLPPLSYGASGYSDILASEIIQLYDYVGASDEGIRFVGEILAYPKLSKSTRSEFLKVKDAFEQDKAEGTKGRPTQVLIQSKYLPW